MAIGEAGNQLNAAQQQAVKIIDGPVLVVAGAGTGKTRVIVERILHLIETGVSPTKILALTFTEKAAGEMQDRVNVARGTVSLDTTIATYNGFGNDFLNDYGAEWGLGRLRLLGETGQLVFLREHFDEFELDYFAPISNPDGQLERLAQYLSLLKQQLVQPETYLAYANKLPATDDAERLDKLKHQELARLYDTYLKLCREHQVIDYDDQLYLTIELLKARPNVLRELQERYQYILVDEFQDTNPMQSALVQMLAGNSQNVMVVGDDDQSIYGWRGATLANILDFRQHYTKATEITLIENYRSTQSILDAAYRLIQHNNPDRLEVINNLDKHLHAQTDDGPRPAALHFATLDAELTWVAEDITRRLASGQEASSIAVLARRRQGVERAHEFLELHDVPHTISGLSNDMYAQPAVRQLIEALRTINDPNDDMALFHTLSGPLFTLPQGTLAEITAGARKEHTPLRIAVELSSAEEFKNALAQIELWRSSSRDLTVGDLAYAIITDSGWKQKLYDQAETDPELYVQAQALSQFFTTLKEFERIAGVPSVQNYFVSLPALQAGGSDFEDASLDISDSQVNVLSVHRAKGLEWDTVYIVDCTEGSFPLQNRGGQLAVPDALKASRSRADEHMSEERRLMYVAATRARHELILTYASKHGNGAPRRPSRFVAELLIDPAKDMAQLTDQTSLELFAPKTTETAAQLPSALQTDGLFVLSVSQIASWLDCPQDFYYKYVLGMPLPANPNAAYGTAIHAVIEQIHEGRRKGRPPTLEEVTARVQSELPLSGYTSARSRDRAHAQAEKSVQAIYTRFMHDPLPMHTEQSFGTVVPDLPLKIVGRIDAVYAHPNGIEIRDYKTSTSVQTPEQAKSRATSSTQLTLYALAWKLQNDEMPALLTLDFVETGLLGSVRKQPKSLETMTAKLRDMVQHLQQGSYPPGKDHTYCAHPL